MGLNIELLVGQLRHLSRGARRILTGVGRTICLGALIACDPVPSAFDERLSEPPMRIEIAPLDRAFTLARTQAGETLLLVQANSFGKYEAVVVPPVSHDEMLDAVGAYAHYGADGLRELAMTGTRQTFELNDFGLPFDAVDRHIAAGTNYRAHADEVGHEGEPFLFPKLSAPTPWNAPVYAGTRLDYEVELCALLLEDYRGGEVAAAYTLCGDFTERWILVREMSLGADMGVTGFAVGKGGESRLPVGPWVVIPKDATLERDMQLNLYWNGALRQRASTADMIWSVKTIADRALASCKREYRGAGDQVHFLTPCEGIPARTLLLTGTPAGVLFSLRTLWNPRAYLQIDDHIVGYGPYLGVTGNSIVAAPGE